MSEMVTCGRNKIATGGGYFVSVLPFTLFCSTNLRSNFPGPGRGIHVRWLRMAIPSSISQTTLIQVEWPRIQVPISIPRTIDRDPRMSLLRLILPNVVESMQITSIQPLYLIQEHTSLMGRVLRNRI